MSGGAKYQEHYPPVLEAQKSTQAYSNRKGMQPDIANRVCINQYLEVTCKSIIRFLRFNFQVCGAAYI